MYKSSINYERTKAETESELASWIRDDIAFFASWACHILAYTFQELHPERVDEIVFIKPKPPYDVGNHVYVRKWEYAFDFSWWTREEELLSIFTNDYRAQHTGWDFDTVVLQVPLEQFCDENNHRKPEYFYGDVVSRAKKYIQKIK